MRFYEEGDAASLVIPPHSEFRRNIDWMDDNFPREVKSTCTFNLSPCIMHTCICTKSYCFIAGQSAQYCVHSRECTYS